MAGERRLGTGKASKLVTPESRCTSVPALGTAMIDVKEIAEMGTPDSNGNTLPLSVTQGRVSFSAASGKPTDPMNVVIGGGIYNPAKAVCGNTCETCDGCCSFQITPDPATVQAGVLTQLYVQCPWTTGALYDYTESSSWSSGNSSVVVFDSPGLASPQDPGSTTVAAQMPSVPMSQGQICTEGSLPPCAYGAPAPIAPTMVIPACPTTATIASTTQLPLSATLTNNFPTYLTGFGALMVISLGVLVEPPLYNGAQVTEAFSGISNTCPASVQQVTACTGNNHLQPAQSHQGGQHTEPRTLLSAMASLPMNTKLHTRQTSSLAKLLTTHVQ